VAASRGRWGVGEDLVLGSVPVPVGLVVDGGTLGIGWVHHVIALVVGPVHGVQDLGASVGPVAPVGVQVARGLPITTNGSDGLADGQLGGVGHVALEGGHVHLVSASNRVVDPEPTAHAEAIGASREVGDIESLELAGNAIVDNREDDEILRLHITLLGLVGNTQSAPSHFRVLGGVDVSRAKSVHAVGPGDTNVTRSISGLAAQSTAHGGEGFVSSDLKVECSTSGELSDGVGLRRVTQCFGSVPPPITEVIILQRLHSLVGVDVPGLLSPHAGDIDGHVSLNT